MICYPLLERCKVMKKLEGKTAVITGGSTGIGAEISKLFAREGAFVYIVSHSNVEKGKAVVQEIMESGGKSQYLQADLSKESEIKDLFEIIKRDTYNLDILINNAGRTFNVEFEDISEKSIKRDLEINLISTMLCSKYAVDLMKDQGWIVNTASIRGMENGGRPGILGYCAAKAGVINFTKSLAVHLAPRVCVNAVAPGFVNTEYIVEHMSEELRSSWLSQIPMKSFVNIHELAKVYLNLVTNRSMTGIVIPVDGGYTLLNR